MILNQDPVVLGGSDSDPFHLKYHIKNPGGNRNRQFVYHAGIRSVQEFNQNLATIQLETKDFLIQGYTLSNYGNSVVFQHFLYVFPVTPKKVCWKWVTSLHDDRKTSMLLS